MNNLKAFLLSVVGGITIGIGGAVYLTLDIKIAGALLFTVGLYTICAHGLNLFTGKIGYLAVKESKEVPEYLIFLAIVWLGNFAGCALTAAAYACTRIGAGLNEKAAAICQVKLNDNYMSLFLLGIFCGMLMYAAVEGYKLTANPVILLLCVSVFILCGFEHCIADMFYFAMAGCINVQVIMALVVITLGNSVGGMMIPAVKRIK